MGQRILLEQGMNDMLKARNANPKPEKEPFRQEGKSLQLEVAYAGRLTRFNLLMTRLPPRRYPSMELRFKSRPLG